MKRISPRGMSAGEAAGIMVKRYGKGALLQASNRCDDANTHERSYFYERVMYEIEKILAGGQK